jgi:hypothetical protein
MDYETAHRFLINQAKATEATPDAFLVRLRQGKPPVPGQVTSILLSLKVIYEALREVDSLERELVYALYLLSSQSRQQFEAKRRSGVTWPPLLDEDLTRIAIAVRNIFAGNWEE